MMSPRWAGGLSMLASSVDPLGWWRWSRWFLGRLGGGSDQWLPVRCRWADMICGDLPEGALAGWRPAGRLRLVTDVVDQVGDRVHDPGGQEREPLGLLVAGDAGQDQDGLEAGLHPGDDVGVHAVADHDGGVRVGVDGPQ